MPLARPVSYAYDSHNSDVAGILNMEVVKQKGNTLPKGWKSKISTPYYGMGLGSGKTTRMFTRIGNFRFEIACYGAFWYTLKAVKFTILYPAYFCHGLTSFEGDKFLYGRGRQTR